MRFSSMAQVERESARGPLTGSDTNGTAACSGKDFSGLAELFPGTSLGLEFEDFGAAFVRARFVAAWSVADLNGDLAVDAADEAIVASHLGMSNPTQADGDLNNDGRVWIEDLDLMFAQYGLDLDVVS